MFRETRTERAVRGVAKTGCLRNGTSEASAKRVNVGVGSGENRFFVKRKRAKRKRAKRANLGSARIKTLIVIAFKSRLAGRCCKINRIELLLRHRERFIISRILSFVDPLHKKRESTAFCDKILDKFVLQYENDFRYFIFVSSREN